MHEDHALEDHAAEEQDAMNASANKVRNLRSVGAGPADAVQGRVLRIVAGLHAGASRPLAEQEMLVVGSGDDCDIVLADTGVAAHHALITLVGGAFTLRALDAPVRIEGKPLHPGDPVEVRPLQRIDLGEAAIAFGGSDEAAWDALFPAIADPARKRRAQPMLRRLPLIAAVAVLALAAVAVIAAFLPRQDQQVDARAYLQSLVPQHRITQSKIGADVNGVPVLSGTVESEADRQRIVQQLRDAGVSASVALRTGEDLARDVREVFRMAGLTVSTRYLGEGTVEIDGKVDQQAFTKVLGSRALADVGVNVVPGPGLAPAAAAPKTDERTRIAAQPPVDIVSVVRGRTPYVVDSDGEQYAVGDMIPGHGRLIVVGSKIYVEGASGEIKQIRPLTAAELAARAAAADFSNVIGTPDAQMNAQAPTPAVNETQATMPTRSQNGAPDEAQSSQQSRQ
jgi:hypothetical protein